MKNNKTIIAVVAIVGLLAICLIGSVTFFALYRNSQNEVNNTTGVRTDTTLTDNANYITDIYNQNMSAVVSVVNLKEISMGEFLDPNGEKSKDIQQSSGSGFVYKVENGTYYAITNYHVVDGSDSLQVVVTIPDKTEPVIVDAELLGGSVISDIAVITFETEEEINPVKIGNSDNIVVGEPVVAMGSPYGTDFQGTTTSGIISGPTRTTTNKTGAELNYIQTDAAINHGNSGGPLFNAQGEVIGVNSLKIADGSTDNMAFAIPINDVMEIVEQIENSAR